MIGNSLPNISNKVANLQPIFGKHFGPTWPNTSNKLSTPLSADQRIRSKIESVRLCRKPPFGINVPISEATIGTNMPIYEAKIGVIETRIKRIRKR